MKITQLALFSFERRVLFGAETLARGWMRQPM